MPRKNSNIKHEARIGSKRGWGATAIIALLAAMLLPFGAAQPALAASSPWNQDSIYGCVDQPIVPFATIPGVQPGQDEFRLAGGRLPEGLELDPRNGVISGTPKGTYRDTFVISVRIDPDFPEQQFTALIDERCRPSVDKIEPSKGSNLGGTEVIITGSDFDERATVEVDDAGTPIYLKDVKAEPNRITVIMPEYSGSGLVTLVIRNPDGSRFIATDGFTYEGGPITPTAFTQPLIDGVPSFGTLRVGQPIADDPLHPELGKVIRTNGTAGVFEVTSDPLIPDLRVRVTTSRVDGSTTSAITGTPTASGPYAFTITTRVEGADPGSYSFEFTGLVRYSTTQVVTFNGNGATSGQMNQQASDIKAPLSTNLLARSGYTFNGWSTNPGGGGSTYLDQALYEFAANVTLYAQWVAIPPVTHTITFNGNGATSGTMAAQTSSAPAAVNANQFVRTGYIFEEWNTQPNGGGTVYYPGDVFSFTHDMTLYAMWKLPTPGGGDEGVSHTITFDGNGATSGATPSQTSRGPAVVRSNGFVRPGYLFHAWNSTRDYTGFELEPGDIFNFGADVTLYAQWDRIPPAAVIIAVDKPLTIDLLAGEVRTIIVKVANTAGALIPVTIEIPAGMIKVDSRVLIRPHATPASWAAGVIDLEIDFTDKAGKDISVLSAPLEIHFTTGLGTNTVARSEDGLTWISIPRLPGKVLPANQADGYYLTPDGAAVILSRHLTEFGYKEAQAAISITANTKLPIQVGLTSTIAAKGGTGTGAYSYKSLTPLICSASNAGVVKGVKVGKCSVQVTRNGDETYVQSAVKLANFTVTPGVIVLEVQKAYIGNRPVVVAATKVQVELGAVNGNKIVGFEISPTSNGLYKVVGALKLNKSGSATFTRTIVKGTTIRIRLDGKTLTTYKFLGN